MVRGLLLALALSSGAPVIAQEVFGGPGIDFQSYTVWHDVSKVDPVLGSPTSVLSYPFLVAPSFDIGLTGYAGQFVYKASVGISGMGGGAFRDLDYYTGGVIFSDTVSRAQLDYGLTGRVEVGSTKFRAQLNGVHVTPVAAAEVRSSGLSNYGLSCVTVCLGSTYPDDVRVIEQKTFGVRGGGGFRAEVDLAETTSLKLGALGFIGVHNVDDSHLLRGDLGATPNILYRNLTVGLEVDMALSHAFSDQLSGFVKASGGYEVGWGTATFAAQTATPLTYPAGFNSLRLNLGVGLSGHF